MKGDQAMRWFDVILRNVAPASEQLYVLRVSAPTRQTALKRAEQLYAGRVVGLIAVDNGCRHNPDDGHHPTDLPAGGQSRAGLEPHGGQKHGGLLWQQGLAFAIRVCSA